MVFSDQRVQVRSTKEALNFEVTVVAPTVLHTISLLMSVAFLTRCLVCCMKRSEQRGTRPPGCGSS